MYGLAKIGGKLIMKSNNQSGFSYIDVMCAIVILMVGILAQVSAMSFSILRQREAELQSVARQITSSTIESIFAARDLGNTDGINDFHAINTTDVSSAGRFVPGWFPVREDSGADGILGTADDTCLGASCTVGTYTNTSPIREGFERKIEITDIVEPGKTVVTKKRIEVKVRFFVGQLQREQTLATLIADLPFYK
jgi:type II secretory pathway pseudopilin PulG